MNTNFWWFKVDAKGVKEPAMVQLTKENLNLSIGEYIVNPDNRNVLELIPEAIKNIEKRTKNNIPGSNEVNMEYFRDNLKLTIEDLLANNKQKTRAAELIRNYNIITEQEAENATDEQIVEILTERLADNLLFVYDSVDPDTRERSKLWYIGANRIAHEIAKKYGLSAQELEAAGAKPQDTDSSQEDDMIRMIKSRGGDPEKLKKRMAFFQGENNE